jgi:hypothetical protein
MNLKFTETSYENAIIELFVEEPGDISGILNAALCFTCHKRKLFFHSHQLRGR